jgi:hypothetical protein
MVYTGLVSVSIMIRNSLDVVDRLLFQTISQVYGESDISEFPIYFSKTPLENDKTGKSSFKLFNINLVYSKNSKLIIVADSSLTISRLYNSLKTKVFDEFFLSRLLSYEIDLHLGNIIDTTAKR